MRHQLPNYHLQPCMQVDIRTGRTIISSFSLLLPPTRHQAPHHLFVFCFPHRRCESLLCSAGTYYCLTDVVCAKTVERSLVWCSVVRHQTSPQIKNVNAVSFHITDTTKSPGIILNILYQNI